MPLTEGCHLPAKRPTGNGKQVAIGRHGGKDGNALDHEDPYSRVSIFSSQGQGNRTGRSRACQPMDHADPEGAGDPFGFERTRLGGSVLKGTGYRMMSAVSMRMSVTGKSVCPGGLLCGRGFRKFR